MKNNHFSKRGEKLKEILILFHSFANQLNIWVNRKHLDSQYFLNLLLNMLFSFKYMRKIHVCCRKMKSILIAFLYN